MTSKGRVILPFFSAIVHFRQNKPENRGWQSPFSVLYYPSNQGCAPYRGVEQLAARRAHNPEVVGSSPASATIKTPDFYTKSGVFLTFWGKMLSAKLVLGLYLVVTHLFEKWKNPEIVCFSFKKVRVFYFFEIKMWLWKKIDTAHFYAGLCIFCRQMVSCHLAVMFLQKSLLQNAIVVIGWYEVI